MMHEKDKVVYNVWEYIETKDEQYKVLAKEWLRKLASKYHLAIKTQKKKTNGDLKEAFRAFLQNEKGYMITLQSLYNYLD
jgi:hypothetical protein